MHTPIEAPLRAVETGSTVGKLNALSQTVTPSGAPMEASKLLGNVAPAIMGTLMGIGTAAIMLLGMKTVITAKPPLKALEKII